CEVDGGLESSIAVAQQHRNIAISVTSPTAAGRVGPAVIGYGQVKPAVAVEVANGQRIWNAARLEVSGGFESAVAISQKDRNGVKSVRIVTERSHSEVELAIAVEIADYNGRTPAAVFNGALERAIALAQQDPGA